MNLRRNLRRAPRRLSLVAVTLLFTLDGSSSLGRAAEASPLPAPPAKMERLDAAALAAQIDKHFEDYWQTAGVEPAPASDDAEFARRVYLILAGKTPPAAEMRDFLEDADPKKRAVLVERLLASLESGSQSEIDAAWAKEADNRIAAYEAGEIEAIPAEQVLAELRARRK